MVVEGRCHCGNVALRLETQRSADDLNPRVCSCRFCQMHGAVYVADSKGAAVIDIAEPAAVIRYRFGEKTTDYLICRKCGSFIGAVLVEEGDCYSALNLNLTNQRELSAGEGAAWRGQSPKERIAWRIARWTPTVVRDD